MKNRPFWVEKTPLSDTQIIYQIVDYIISPMIFPLNIHIIKSPSYPVKNIITIKPPPKSGPTFGQMSSAQEIRQLPCRVGSGSSRRTGAPFDRWISGEKWENQWDFVDFWVDEWDYGTKKDHLFHGFLYGKISRNMSKPRLVNPPIAEQGACRFSSKPHLGIWKSCFFHSRNSNLGDEHSPSSPSRVSQLFKDLSSEKLINPTSPTSPTSYVWNHKFYHLLAIHPLMLSRNHRFWCDTYPFYTHSCW